MCHSCTTEPGATFHVASSDTARYPIRFNLSRCAMFSRKRENVVMVEVFLIFRTQMRLACCVMSVPSVPSVALRGAVRILHRPRVSAWECCQRDSHEEINPDHVVIVTYSVYSEAIS
jgi:hypothetical protein